MAYTAEKGRNFWLAFDNHFKFEASQNGLWAKYETWGGYAFCFTMWENTRNIGTYPNAFAAFARENETNLLFVADEQERFFANHFSSDIAEMTRAFQDFGFGVLESNDRPNRGGEPVHMMNGGQFAQDYASWHGYIEAVNVIRPDSDIWTNMRWLNGMAWELQVKARPQDAFPNQNSPLSPEITAAIEEKWKNRSVDEIAAEFDDYRNRPFIWLS